MAEAALTVIYEIATKHQVYQIRGNPDCAQGAGFDYGAALLFRGHDSNVWSEALFIEPEALAAFAAAFRSFLRDDYLGRIR